MNRPPDETDTYIHTVQLPGRKELVQVLLLAIAALIMLSLAQDLIRHAVFEGGRIDEGGLIMAFFDLDAEVNLPTWFQTLLTAAIGGLLLAWRGELVVGGGARWGWVLLGFAFLALSLDEMASLHEKLMGPMREIFSITSGPLLYAWVIPVGLLTLVLFLVLVPFLKSLPRATLIRFLVAGFVFVSGALLLEMVGASLATTLGDTALYDGVTSLEEAMEMVGAVLFLRALLIHKECENREGAPRPIAAPDA